MKTRHYRWVVLVVASGALLAEEPTRVANPAVGPPAPASIVDNLDLNAGAGFERPPGEDSTGFATFGFNWGIPLTPPSGVALGLQLGGSLKLRDDDPEWNATLGGFGRNFPTVGTQHGAAAVLVDYQRTAFHSDLVALRPILGTTISAQDALGVEGVVSLNQHHDQAFINSVTTFWTRGWNRMLGTEFGAGYEFCRQDGALMRARAALGLTRAVDLWCGGDINSHGRFAIGLGVTYHFGSTGRHAILHTIGGEGSGLDTPFPATDFPGLLRRTK